MGSLKNKAEKVFFVITVILYVILNLVLTVSSYALIPPSARDRSSLSLEDSTRNRMFLYELHPNQYTYKYKDRDLKIGKAWVEIPRKLNGRIFILPFLFNMYSSHQGYVFVFEIENLKDFSSLEKTSFDFKEIKKDSYFNGGFQNNLYRLKLRAPLKTSERFQ